MIILSEIKLFIEEKPSLAQAIATGIGDGETVQKSVEQSLKNLRDNAEFQGLKNAAFGRSRTDWLVEMNLLRAYISLDSPQGSPTKSL